jgi:large subunit ribosomal protein L23
MNAYEVIKTVRLTEKSQESTTLDKYTFEVHPNADKLLIKRAVREVFEREVKSVNVMQRRGKTKRTRYGTGKKPDKKIAIVTLMPGQAPIELF